MIEEQEIERMRLRNKLIIYATSAILSGFAIGLALGKCAMWLIFPQLRIYSFWEM